jgi:hypothetical protein
LSLDQDHPARHFPAIPERTGQQIEKTREPMRLILAAATVLTLALGFGLPVQPKANATDAPAARSLAQATVTLSTYR